MFHLTRALTLLALPQHTSPHLTSSLQGRLRREQALRLPRQATHGSERLPQRRRFRGPRGLQFSLLGRRYRTAQVERRSQAGVAGFQGGDGRGHGRYTGADLGL